MAQRVKTFNARPDDLSWISEGHRSSKVWTPASSSLTPRHVFHVCVYVCWPARSRSSPVSVSQH